MELTIVQTLTPSIAAGIAAIIFVGLWIVTRKKNGGLPYPPGPKGLPLIENVLDLNVKEPHVTYTKWAEQYGLHLLFSWDARDTMLMCLQGALSTLASLVKILSL